MVPYYKNSQNRLITIASYHDTLPIYPPHKRLVFLRYSSLLLCCSVINRKMSISLFSWVHCPDGALIEYSNSIFLRISWSSNTPKRFAMHAPTHYSSVLSILGGSASSMSSSFVKYIHYMVLLFRYMPGPEVGEFCQ